MEGKYWPRIFALSVDVSWPGIVVTILMACGLSALTASLVKRGAHKDVQKSPQKKEFETYHLAGTGDSNGRAEVIPPRTDRRLFHESSPARTPPGEPYPCAFARKIDFAIPLRNCDQPIRPRILQLRIRER